MSLRVEEKVMAVLVLDSHCYLPAVSKFIHSFNKYLLSIYYRHFLVYILVGGRLTKTNVQFLLFKREIPHKKERREELTLITRHLFVAKRPSGTLSEICCSAKMAPLNTWYSTHFLKYPCSYYSTALIHLSSHVWD